MLIRTRNPNSELYNLSGLKWSWRFLIITSFLILSSSVNGFIANSGRNQSLEWQVLTKINFSSQIRLHPHILLLVTVPWSGESRALMKDIANMASYKSEEFGPLSLMVIYRNAEKMLADVLGATERTTIFCYHHSLSYKYQGRFRAQNVLSSVHHLMSLRSDEIPLKLLNTPEDLKTFSESTDKAVLLLEFCGWTRILLDKRKNNRSENAFERDESDSDIIFGEILNGETNQTLTSSGKKSEKGMRNEKLSCGIEKGLSGTPWLEGLIFTNETVPSEAENTGPDGGVSCTFEEFRRYESFLSQFERVAREFSLPPERQRFALISERSLVSSLGVKDPDSWLVMLNIAECPNCSKILKEGDDLKTVLRMHQSPVTELESEGHDTDPTLPANGPSIVLFVDRSSESSDIRRKSKEALDAFRRLALYKSVIRRESPAQVFKARKGRTTSNPSGRSIKETSPLTQVDKLKNKISLMLINEDGTAALDGIPTGAQGKSIQDILNYLIQQKKEAKLSMLAKEVGFQLLSDDLDVKIADMLPPQTATKSKELSEPPIEAIVENSLNLDSGSLKKLSEPPMEAIVENSLNLDSGSLVNAAIRTPEDLTKQPQLTDGEPFHYSEEDIAVRDTQLKQQVGSDTVVAEDMMVKDKSTKGVDNMEQQVHHHVFSGLCFFSDGDYQLLRALTAGSKVPSVVILDPITQQHYVFPEEAGFSYSLLVDFLDRFLNRTLSPYQRSEPVLVSSREATRPPFINLDFHEVDSIPRVTANKFSELVLGFNQSDTENFGLAWKKDVLVLFTNSWCGFCQRMELVVREVFRAFKNYMKMLKSGSKNGESMFNYENSEDATTYELPLVYLMDCTLNDCRSLLNSMGQRELYPALILFPAQRKSAVSYQGDMSVTGIIKFIADHGSDSHHLSGDKGFTSAGGQGGVNHVPTKDPSPTSILDKYPEEMGESHEVLLNSRTPTSAIDLQSIGSRSSNELHVGSILISTDKLLNAPPFDQSKILIVQADQHTGFQGLIINKHINWESLQGLETGFDLVKQAPLFFGGPLMASGMPLVSLSRRVAEAGQKKIFPSVYFLDQFATVRAIEGLKAGNLSANDCWFFLGYSSWGWDQLFGEIAEGAWYISEDPEGGFHWPEISRTLTFDEPNPQH